jgi:tetratricopeptide (TPR) repeat protein
MDWYLNLTSFLLKQNPVEHADDLRHELEKRVVGLYKALISYQIASVCSYSRHQGLDFLRDIVHLNDWDGSLAKIHDAESLLRQDLAQYDMQQIVSHLGRLSVTTESINARLSYRNEQPIISEPPAPLWIVPLGRNRDFVGRDEVLQQLLEKIPPDSDEQDCQRVALEGLGGIGKTQIALEAAFRVHAKHGCSVFWVPAVDATTFENAYREIGRQLKINGIDEDTADIKLLVKTSLSQSPSDWLLIIDNADDVELLFAGRTPLFDYLPFSRRGSILFTTRNSGIAMKMGISLKNTITVGEMSEVEATELLRGSLREHQMDNADSMKDLINFLSCLPLAIRQASSYLSETGMSVTRYLHHCRSSNRSLIKLLSRDFADLGRYKSIENPIATTWLISFNHISRENQLAARYLKFMCFLAEKAIPVSLLPPSDELESVEALSILRAYAFITERVGHHSYDVHRLVRLVMQNWLAEEGELKAWVNAIAQRLSRIFPYPEHENRMVWGSYFPHVVRVLEFRDSWIDEEVELELLFRITRCRFILGRYNEAERTYRYVLERQIKTLGTEHPTTLDIMDSLAVVVNKLHNYSEAERLHRKTLELWKKLRGVDHPLVFSSMNNLAVVLDNQGRYTESETIHRQTLEQRERIFGVKHPWTLESMNNLAIVLSKQEKYIEAEKLHRQTLEIRREIFGLEHPSTLDSMNNFGLFLNSQGKSVEAETIHRQTLKHRTEILGADHPSTLNSLINLAQALDYQGRHDESKMIQQQESYLRSNRESIPHV